MILEYIMVHFKPDDLQKVKNFYSKVKNHKIQFEIPRKTQCTSTTKQPYNEPIRPYT